MVIFAGHGPDGSALSLISAVSCSAVRLGLRTLRDPCSSTKSRGRPPGDRLILVFALLTRLTDFADGNERQHGKDRKS
jgi:hypothetical protein